MTLIIGNDLVVSIHYKLTDQSGQLLDSSEGKEPLSYLHGAGNIIPGLEKALLGKSFGDKANVVIEPSEAYGELREDLIQVVPRSAFDGIETIEPGMVFHAQGEAGQVQNITVKKIEGDQITIDANHPLAGVTLSFDVEIVGIREASEEEIAHQHPHGPHGHHH